MEAELNPQAALEMRYTPRGTRLAIKRVLRYLRNNTRGTVPPRHIKEKMRLVRPKQV